MLEFAHHWHARVSPAPGGCTLSGAALSGGVATPWGPLPTADLAAAAAEYGRVVRGGYDPPLGALVAFMTGEAAALYGALPLAATLAPAELAAFGALIGELAGPDGLDLRLFDEGWGPPREVPLPADAALLVAGHVAELFFFRRDLLGRLLAARPRIWLYATPRAFASHGGAAGGCYSPRLGAIQLVLSRLYEGWGPAPGVAPLLHELGHMLDCLDVARGALGPASGLYPGLRPADGPAFSPAARAAFLAGKAAEIERYRRRVGGDHGGPPPIGHPYVFQNDGEFLAGYLELFFRSPNAFAAANPALFDGYVKLFGQDPRRAWAADFPFYIEENRRYYASGATPPPDGLSLPAY